METRVQSHVAYRLLYHIVWIPKWRNHLLIKDLQEYFEKVLRHVLAERYPDVLLEEISVLTDHVHVVMVIPPKYAISAVIGAVKSDSSRGLRKRFDYLRRGRKELWSTGYFVSSVGLDEERIRHYVQYQEQQDSGQLKAVWEKEATGKA